MPALPRSLRAHGAGGLHPGRPWQRTLGTRFFWPGPHGSASMGAWARQLYPSGMPTSPTILIVDDHRAVREELAFALGYDGWQTRQAVDGPTGLAAAQDPAVDLVLLDVKLPGLDGLEVLVKLKEARPLLPIVMISGHGDLDTAVLAVRRGASPLRPTPSPRDDRPARRPPGAVPESRQPSRPRA